MAETWAAAQEEQAERQRQAQEHTERLRKVTEDRRRSLRTLVDILGWEEVITFLAEMASDEYTCNNRPYAKKLAEDLEAIVSELW